MGQTLTHGVYLPSEGERNCYSGLASNWRLLNGAIGTVAAHTTAIAEKAPLVHTHTKADITDFPAYGTTAGTICEGNDSRLSDARTPVAHTHGKADITDLFSSANTWRANNTYSADCIIYNSNSSGSVAGLKLRNSKAEVLSTGNTSSDQSITFRDKNDVAIGYVRGAVQSTSVALKIGAYAKDSSNNTVNTELQLLAYSNGNKAIFPSTTGAYDLGSSSYQWNNLYAKNYYYNGVAWGLDKANVYSLEQTISATSGKSWNVKNTNYTLGENTPSSDKLVGAFAVQDNDNNNAFLFNLNHYSNGEIISRWLTRFKFTNGVKSTTGTQKAAVIEMGLTNSGDRFARPGTNGDMDLGTSTNKWKSLNGINPGALSLPNVRAAVADPVDTVNWNLTGSRNTYTPTEDGWFFIRITGADGCSVNVHAGSSSNDYPTWTNSSAGGDTTLVVPAEKGITLYVYVKATSISYCSFRPCLGNV